MNLVSYEKPEDDDSRAQDPDALLAGVDELLADDSLDSGQRKRGGVIALQLLELCAKRHPQRKVDLETARVRVANEVFDLKARLVDGEAVRGV